MPSLQMFVDQAAKEGVFPRSQDARVRFETLGKFNEIYNGKQNPNRDSGIQFLLLRVTPISLSIHDFIS